MIFRQLVSEFRAGRVLLIPLPNFLPRELGHIRASGHTPGSRDHIRPGNRISIHVVVTDKKGRPVRELQPGSFTAFDNDEPQRLLAFRVMAVGDENAGYLLTFEGERADRSGGYHEIAMRVDRPSLNARTIRGWCQDQ